MDNLPPSKKERIITPPQGVSPGNPRCRVWERPRITVNIKMECKKKKRTKSMGLKITFWKQKGKMIGLKLSMLRATHLLISSFI